jgi:hypothetical protein
LTHGFFLREPLLGGILEYTGEAVPCLGSVDLSCLRLCGNSEFIVRRYPVEEKAEPQDQEHGSSERR